MKSESITETAVRAVLKKGKISLPDLAVLNITRALETLRLWYLTRIKLAGSPLWKDEDVRTKTKSEYDDAVARDKTIREAKAIILESLDVISKQLKKSKASPFAFFPKDLENQIAKTKSLAAEVELFCEPHIIMLKAAAAKEKGPLRVPCFEPHQQALNDNLQRCPLTRSLGLGVLPTMQKVERAPYSPHGSRRDPALAECVETLLAAGVERSSAVVTRLVELVHSAFEELQTARGLEDILQKTYLRKE